MINPYYFLPFVFLMCVIGAGTSYTELRHKWWYLPLIALLAAGCGYLFGLAAKMLNDNSKLYVFSLAYDALMIFCYYVLPIVLFGTKLKPEVIIGAVLIIIGFTIIHVYGG